MTLLGLHVSVQQPIDARLIARALAFDPADADLTLFTVAPVVIARCQHRAVA